MDASAPAMLWRYSWLRLSRLEKSGEEVMARTQHPNGRKARASYAKPGRKSRPRSGIYILELGRGIFWSRAIPGQRLDGTIIPKLDLGVLPLAKVFTTPREEAIRRRWPFGAMLVANKPRYV
jgi:hypothetical protein